MKFRLIESTSDNNREALISFINNVTKKNVGEEVLNIWTEIFANRFSKYFKWDKELAITKAKEYIICPAFANEILPDKNGDSKLFETEAADNIEVTSKNYRQSWKSLLQRGSTERFLTASDISSDYKNHKKQYPKNFIPEDIVFYYKEIGNTNLWWNNNISVGECSERQRDFFEKNKNVPWAYDYQDDKIERFEISKKEYEKEKKKELVNHDKLMDFKFAIGYDEPITDVVREMIYIYLNSKKGIRDKNKDHYYYKKVLSRVT